MIKPTNIDIQDAACLHVVHILQHPTSRLTPSSTKDTKVNATKKNHSPLLVGKYGKSTKQSTWRRHQVSKGTSSLEEEGVRALGALRSWQSQKKLSVEYRQGTHFVCNKEKEKWIEHHVDRETAGARKWVEDTETAIVQAQEDMSNAEQERLTTRKPGQTFEEMFNAIGDILSDLATSDDEEDWEDEEDEEDTELGKLREDDEPGWVMGTMSKTVQHSMESFRQKQMRLDKLTQQGWGDTADYFRKSDMKYGIAELMIPAIVKPQTDTTIAIPLPTTFGEIMLTLDIVPGQSQMLRGTSWPESSQMTVGSSKPQSRTHIASLLTDVVDNLLPIGNMKPVAPVSFDHRISRSKVITI